MKEVDDLSPPPVRRYRIPNPLFRVVIEFDVESIRHEMQPYLHSPPSPDPETVTIVNKYVRWWRSRRTGSSVRM